MQVGTVLTLLIRRKRLSGKSWDATSDYGVINFTVVLGQRVTPIDKLVEQGPSLDLLSKPLFVLLHR